MLKIYTNGESVYTKFEDGTWYENVDGCNSIEYIASKVLSMAGVEFEMIDEEN
nr:hypothetical protein [Clostridioides sp.]